MAVHTRLYSLTLLSSFSPCTASKKQEEEGKQKDHLEDMSFVKARTRLSICVPPILNTHIARHSTEAMYGICLTDSRLPVGKSSSIIVGDSFTFRFGVVVSFCFVYSKLRLPSPGDE